MLIPRNSIIPLLNKFSRMKQIILLITLLIAFVGITNAQKLLGTGDWLLTKVVVEDKEQEVYTPVSFLENGNMNVMGMNMGSWDYNQQKNKFNIVSTQFEELAGKNKVIKINSNELILNNNGTKIYFIKLDIEKIAKENKSSGLIGTWELEGDNNSDGLKLAIFEAPDLLTLIEKAPGMESKSSGQWIFNKKEKSLLIIGQIENLRGKNKVAKIDENEIELVNNGVILKAKRKLKSTIKIDRLSFTEADFYDENDEYKYYDHEAKLPWQDVYEMIADMANVKQLIYTHSTLIEGTEVFENKILTANVKASKEEQTLSIDFIFYGYDRYNLPEDTELPPNKNYTNLLYPEKESSFRVTGTEQITTPAGTFDCTVLEVCGDFDIRKKLWMINDKPGIYAKIIEDKSGDFGHYKNLELLEIK